MKCTYAAQGTYGHECGNEATRIAVMTSRFTKTGIYYAGRCDQCVTKMGKDNANILRLEQVADQVNTWL